MSVLSRWKFLSLWIVLAACGLALVSCQDGGGGESEEPAEEVLGERIENPSNGVAVAALPGFFRLALNNESGIVLEPADAAVAGNLRVKAGDVESGGINLVAATKVHKEEILAREGGDYKGQRELGSQLGTAFYSRGHYPGDNGEMLEETVVFMVHPWGDRTLQMIYVYPVADDSAARIQDQLFGVLGELEPLGVEPPAAADAAADA